MLLTLLQLYSISLVDVFLVLFILPFGILLPFPAGINALFSHGPRRSVGLARVYALWNVTSLINVVSLLVFAVELIFLFKRDPNSSLESLIKMNGLGGRTVICAPFWLPRTRLKITEI